MDETSQEPGHNECPLAGGDAWGDLRAPARGNEGVQTGWGGGPGRSYGWPACGKACPGRSPPGWASSRPTRLPVPTHLLRASVEDSEGIQQKVDHGGGSFHAHRGA
ncbi:hypothetical protein LEMLEM_LOCUS24053 [Lemmus lemmus]